MIASKEEPYCLEFLSVLKPIIDYIESFEYMEEVLQCVNLEDIEHYINNDVNIKPLLKVCDRAVGIYLIGHVVNLAILSSGDYGPNCYDVAVLTYLHIVCSCLPELSHPIKAAAKMMKRADWTSYYLARL